MQLSKRLMAVVKMVTPCNVVADIGTDHGYIPIYLVRARIARRAIAMDVNVGPLEVAKENIATYKCINKIETRLSDGVTALIDNEVDTVVIAGMGGNLIMRILANGVATLATVKELVLQPQSEIKVVREFLQENGYCIIAEDMVCEDGKYYPIMRVIRGDMNLSNEIEFRYGPWLLKNKNPVLKEFLEKEKNTLEKIVKQINEGGGELAAKRVQEIKQEMGQNELACSEYE